MNVKIRSPFKPDKICNLIGFEGDLCKLQAVNEFSLPGLNFKPGDRFLMSPSEIIFPGEELAGDVMRVAGEELAALKAQRDELLAALVGLADFANGKLGQNPYSIPQFKAACVAACHAVGYPTEGKIDKGAWMDGIDKARALLAKLEGGGK